MSAYTYGSSLAIGWSGEWWSNLEQSIGSSAITKLHTFLIIDVSMNWEFSSGKYP